MAGVYVSIVSIRGGHNAPKSKITNYKELQQVYSLYAKNYFFNMLKSYLKLF